MGGAGRAAVKRVKAENPLVLGALGLGNSPLPPIPQRANNIAPGRPKRP